MLVLVSANGTRILLWKIYNVNYEFLGNPPQYFPMVIDTATNISYVSGKEVIYYAPSSIVYCVIKNFIRF